jgi:diguanylate cyclase (GGDEF)-like protein/PAS domain S-box-containing protein
MVMTRATVIILDALDFGIIILDHERRVVGWNGWVAQRSGIPKDAALGCLLDEMMPDIVDSRLSTAIHLALGNGITSYLSRAIHKTPMPLYREKSDSVKERIQQEIIVKSLPNGGTRQCLIEIRDASSDYAREQALRENEQKLRTVLEDQLDMICRFFPDTTLTYVNGAYAKYFGQRPESLIGKRMVDFLPDNEQSGMMNHLAKFSARVPVRQVERQVTTPTGIRWHLWTDRAIFDGEGNIVQFQSIGSDITARKELEDQLRQLATIDSLTGLANRRHFLASANKEFNTMRRHGRELAFFAIDIDHFKKINDTYGHAIGDEALRRFAEVCQETLRSSDVIGRLGGEEFAVALPEISLDTASDVAERLRKLISEIRVPTPQGDVAFTVSIGVTCAMPEDTSAERALIRADIALYSAKRSGRNQIKVNISENELVS